MADTETLIEALHILARDIESGDGVANACIAEAAEQLTGYAERLSELESQRSIWEQAFNEMKYQRDRVISKEKQAAMMELADIVQGILTYKTEQHFVLKDRLRKSWEKWRAA